MSFDMLKIMTALAFVALAVQNSRAADWCVARPEAPDNELQAGMDFACTGRNGWCSHIQPDQSCYLPNTIKDHASYAYNIYYQFNKDGPDGGKACYFNGTGMTVYSDPSYDGCVYPYLD